MKLRTIAVAALLLCLFCISAFAGPIPTYTGKVLDRQTGKPIKDASVLIYWVKSIPGFMHADSEPMKAELVITDHRGIYSLGGFIAFLGLTAWHDYTQVIIYRPGYQAYIKRIWEQDRDANNGQNFKTTDNLVKLEHIPPDFDHGKHYKEIEDALRGIDDYSYMQPDSSVTWDGIKNSALKGHPEKQELLRRAYWEEERSRRKYER